MWGVKRGESAARGVVLPPADAQIAATAIVHGMVVVTRNEVDLQRCGATTVNPWS
jgi:predicted nucleic acid-binding protein